MGEKSSEKKLMPMQTDAFTAASFFALAENAPDIICRFDKNYYHLYVNPAIEKITGTPTSAFIGKATYEVGMAPEFAQFWTEQIEYVFNTQKPHMFEFDFPSSEGTKYFQSSVVPEFDENGNMVTVLSISRDITIIRQQEKEKDAFLAMITHELKTPITSAKLLAQMLQKSPTLTNDKKKADQIKKIDTQLDKLTKLIDDLLDATRIGAGKMQFHKKSFNFSELLEEVINEVKETNNSHPIILKELQEVKIFGDKDRIGQVLLNLLSNAIKYSPDSLPVTVSTHLEDQHLVCCVQDSGPGIPKEKQEKLFQKFSRLTEKNHADSPGLGLGLYISAEIIKQEGGSIWVESDKGKETTFCFTLPIKEVKED